MRDIWEKIIIGIIMKVTEDHFKFLSLFSHHTIPNLNILYCLFEPNVVKP